MPGRHHLLTRFQQDYLERALKPGALKGLDGKPFEDRVEGVVWAVTSANHEGTRRNPIPAHRREAAIERFSAELGLEALVYLIDDIGATEKFARYVLKKIEADSRGRLKLSPRNTVVACSTPEVIVQYEELGFRILPVELKDRAARRFHAQTPWAVLQDLVAGKPGFDEKASAASLDLYRRYGYRELVVDLHRHPVLTEDGDLTATRDYNTYARSFDQGAERKYALIKDLVVPGRVVDIGCCAGAVLKELSFDARLRESDLYGVEVARPLYTECLHRKQRGDFGQDNVFFHQADAVGRELFAPGSVNTFTTFALTHELESYLGRRTLKAFLRRLHKQLAPGGRWLNVDVVGPEDGDREVLLWLDRADGRGEDWERSFKDRARLKEHLDGLSTYGRFLRFARDFRRGEGYRLRWKPEGESVLLSLRDACEFLSKKDYTDNWDSELHETFCFWGFSQWKAAVEEAGFRVHPASAAYTNPWLVENRYAGRARLMTLEGAPLPWPPTNMLLAAEKP